MSRLVAKLEYPQDNIPLILQSSYCEDEFYGVDRFESKRMRIILAKYGCRHCFHTLPSHVTSELHPFAWDKPGQCFRIRMDHKVTVHLNTLEEAIVNHPIFEEE
jgi:hypothetical protein